MFDKNLKVLYWLKKIKYLFKISKNLWKNKLIFCILYIGLNIGFFILYFGWLFASPALIILATVNKRKLGIE